MTLSLETPEHWINVAHLVLCLSKEMTKLPDSVCWMQWLNSLNLSDTESLYKLIK